MFLSWQVYSWIFPNWFEDVYIMELLLIERVFCKLQIWYTFYIFILLHCYIAFGVIIVEVFFYKSVSVSQGITTVIRIFCQINKWFKKTFLIFSINGRSKQFIVIGWGRNCQLEWGFYDILYFCILRCPLF